MYVLWVIGALKQVFGSSNILIKMPAIICDIATGFVIYRIADKRFGNARASLISALYLFNPAVVMNSAISVSYTHLNKESMHRNRQTVYRDDTAA